MDLTTGQQLHARSVNGAALSDAERQALAQWYAEQDAAEFAELSRFPKVDNESMRKQIDDVLSQISVVANRIRDLDAENERLEKELASA